MTRLTGEMGGVPRRVNKFRTVSRGRYFRLRRIDRISSFSKCKYESFVQHDTDSRIGRLSEELRVSGIQDHSDRHKNPVPAD